VRTEGGATAAGATAVGVLFDLDGVIVDSREHHMAAWEIWAREHAPHAPANHFLESFGKRNDAIIGELFEGISPEELDRLADKKEALFRKRARGNLVLLPGVLELLDALDEAGVPRAIVTSTPRPNLDLILETLALEGRFQALVSAEDTQRGKPDPEGFLLAAARLGVSPERCVVVEDAPAGLEAAKAGGMRAIGVTTTRPAPDLAAADLVVDSLSEEDVREFILRGA
jgi:HAD superfamily hydrolase (TIGR01509 family)